MPSTEQIVWYLARMNAAQKANLRYMLTALLLNQHLSETAQYEIKVTLDHFDQACFDFPLLAKYLSNTMIDVAANDYEFGLGADGEVVPTLPRKSRTK